MFLRLRTIAALIIGFVAGWLVASGRGRELFDRGRAAVGQVADDTGLTDAASQVGENAARVGEGAARQAGEQARDAVQKVADQLDGIAEQVDPGVTNGAKSGTTKTASTHKATGTSTKAKSAAHS